MVYIANRRHTERTNPQTSVMVFTNMPEVELLVNGVSVGICKPDAYATCQWSDVHLTSGENVVEVRAGKGKKMQTDRVIWNVR